MSIVQSARSARSGGEFFSGPSDPTQRRYEALRASLVEGRPAAELAEAFGYATDSVHDMVAEFRAGRRDFFVQPRRGPKVAPGKEAARARIVELRQAGHSIQPHRVLRGRGGGGLPPAVASAGSPAGRPPTGIPAEGRRPRLGGLPRQGRDQ